MPELPDLEYIVANLAGRIAGGRIDDMINLGAVKIFPSQVEQAILTVKGLEPQYEIIVDRENGVDTLAVRVEISESMTGIDEMKMLDATRARLAQEMEALLGVQARVTLAEPRSIARQQEGKARRVIDKRSR